MQISKNRTELDHHFRSLVIILGSEIKLEEMDEILEGYNFGLDISDIDEEDNTNDDEGIHENVRLQLKTLRESTLTGIHFSRLYLNIVNSLPSCDGEINVMYAPDLIKKVLVHDMALSPLWTGIVSENMSNSPVERWHGILNNSVLKTKKTIEDFIIMNYWNIKNGCK